MPGPASMPWSLKGVSRDARMAAKTAAREAGLSIGAWLTRVIHAAAAAEGVPRPAAAARDSLIERAMARLETGPAPGPPATASATADGVED